MLDLHTGAAAKGPHSEKSHNFPPAHRDAHRHWLALQGIRLERADGDLHADGAYVQVA